MATVSAAELKKEVTKAIKLGFGTTSPRKLKSILKGQADEWGCTRIIAGGFIFLYSANPNMYASYRVKWMNNEMALDQASYTKRGAFRLKSANMNLISVF